MLSRPLKRRLRTLRDRLRLNLRGYGAITGYLAIDGWLKIGEATRLFDLARALPGPAPVVVEIGSWLGKSTVVLGRALERFPGAKLYCIDPFNADGDEFSKPTYAARSAAAGGTLLDRFKANLARNRVRTEVIPLPGYSHDVAPGFQHQIDFLFIDGNHAYDAVRRDFLDWTPKVRRGGVIAFHDVGRSNSPGPLQVIEELIKGRPAFRNQAQVDSLYHLTKA